MQILSQLRIIYTFNPFSLIWSICATVNEEGRKKMDAYIRELEGVFPVLDTIYEYYVDVKQKCLASWENQLSENWKCNPKYNSCSKKKKKYM